MADYYVDATGGNDGWPGTIGQPWQTTTKVTTEIGLGTFTGGDQILFKRGETWTVTGAASCVRFAGSSGSIGNHIYIAPYGAGARPIFTSVAWFWRGLFFRENGDAAGNYWTIEGLEFTNYPGSAGVWIGDGHHFHLIDLYVHATQVNANWKCGIRVADNSQYVWIEDCEVDAIDYGEGIYVGTGYSTADRSRRVEIRNCTITNCEHEGLDLKVGSTECFAIGCNFVNNGVGVDQSHIGMGGRYHHAMRCEFSSTTGNHRQAVYMSQYTLGAYDSGYNTVDRCLFKDETGARGCIDMVFTNNVVTNCTMVDSTIGVYGQSGGAASNKIKNNIFEGLSSNEIYLTNSASYYDCDYNCYGDGGVNIWYAGGANRNMAYVQGTLGQELNATTSDPVFADVVDYNLDTGSPCIDAGDASATVYDWEYEYQPPTGSVDMGWLEYDWDLPNRTFKSVIEDSSFSRFTGDVGISADTGTVYAGPYSIEANITDTSDRYVYVTGLGELEHFYFSFQVNTDSLTMGAGDSFVIFHGRTAGNVALCLVKLDYDGANIRIGGGIIDDASSWTNTGWFNLPAGWNHVQIYWSASPDTSYNEGEYVLWLNETEMAHLNGVNNHDRTVDRFYLGTVTGLDATTSGSIFFDVPRMDHIRYMDEYPYGPEPPEPPPPPPPPGTSAEEAIIFLVPSFHETLGLSIAYSDPLIKEERAAYLGELSPELAAYEQETAAVGGYLSARFDLAGNLVDVDEWFEHSLGRHLEVYSPDLELVWEGFVNQVGVNAGQYAATRGPLVEVANRVYVIYSERDTTVNPPVTIPGMITTISQDTDSQARWGIWEKAVSGGETDATGAQYLRDVFLAESAEPVTDDPRVVLEAGGQVSVSVECLGYWAWMLAYPYQDTTGGTVTCTTKVQTILQGDTNGIFSVDYSQIGSNLALAPRYEDAGVPAWNVMKALAALGDINNDRWTFGVYEGRRARYEIIPGDVAYQHRLADPSQRIETVIGGELRPWEVRPARWLYLPDFLTGRGQPEQSGDKRTDPRFIFVESVRYRAPYTVEITGTRVGRLAQIQAKQGFGGV